jgi:hypothetical protein
MEVGGAISFFIIEALNVAKQTKKAKLNSH